MVSASATPYPRASLLLAAVVLLASTLITGCRKEAPVGPSFTVVKVARGSVAVTASADGVIEPITKVEVKSKASGEVIAMNADTGDDVTAGQLLVQLLPRDAQNAFDQASADLESAEARLANARVRLERSRTLFAEGLLSKADLDVDELAVTTAKGDVVRVQKARENTAERLSETNVRSPINGTVLARSVEVGQVVSSAVSQVSGGTLLLTLADLSVVQVRSLVDEVDIGKVRAGQPVTIRVEAFSDRSFKGEVLKIEPQAVVQQNVTMFPVLTRIENPERLLKPGMNAEIEVLIDRRDDVLTVPVDALRRPEEAGRVAAFLGLSSGSGEAGSDGPGASSTRTSASGDAGGGPRPAGGRPVEGGRPGPASDDVRVVFVRGVDGQISPVRVRVGLRNWEVGEVVEGLSEGDEIALLPSAQQLRQNEDFRRRMEQMRGIPGMSGSSGGSGSGASGSRRPGR